MRTTIDINDALLRDLRARAAERGRPFREVVEEAIALGLAQQTRETPRPRFKLTPHRLGLKAGFRGMSLNQLYDQIEAEKDAAG
jgi:hypothetical protein